MKVPFIARHPGRIPAGVVCDSLVSAYDFMPTLLDYLGLKPLDMAKRPGVSFVPALLGQGFERPGGIVVMDEYGPNLVVLYYFFSMSTKVAAQNSLYIILISQITSVTTTLFTKTVPEFEWLWLVLMVAGGIGGGAVGRKINKKIDDKHVEILFIGLMFTIIGISCYNTWALMK